MNSPNATGLTTVRVDTKLVAAKEVTLLREDVNMTTRRES